jgi:hypothetical protein
VVKYGKGWRGGQLAVVAFFDESSCVSGDLDIDKALEKIMVVSR